jgi:hypothetical protein
MGKKIVTSGDYPPVRYVTDSDCRPYALLDSAGMVTTKDGHFRSELARCRSAWTSCRSRPILIGRREDDLLSGGFRRREARCCVVVSREEEEPECSQVPEHDVTPCPEAVLAFWMPSIQGAIASRRKRLPSSYRSGFHHRAVAKGSAVSKMGMFDFRSQA